MACQLETLYSGDSVSLESPGHPAIESTAIISIYFAKGFFFFFFWRGGDSEGKKEQIFMVNTKHAASGHGESEINRLFFFFFWRGDIHVRKPVFIL